ncbi:MAG: copper resistance protein NlpE N-terminal domain-containing protein [Tannerellaceae bacterium]|nr:copper resistance protein NlpE N-terminal domain-containing protein [Tannerellaceae bacterium]
MKSYLIAAGIAVFLITSCNPNRKPDPSMDSSPMMTGYPASSNNETRQEAEEFENSYNLRDYNGIYEGILPSASGEGIDTELSLYDDNSYILRSIYQGKEEVNGFEEHGTYSVAGEILTLRSNGENQYYKIEENALLKLDNDRQEITGELADHYRLQKK